MRWPRCSLWRRQIHGVFHQRIESRVIVSIVVALAHTVIAVVGWSVVNRPRVVEPVVSMASPSALSAVEHVPVVCASPGTGTTLVNLNTASTAELESLPGVGPVMARRIVDWRQAHGTFTDIRELREIEGIGDKVFRRLASLVTL